MSPFALLLVTHIVLAVSLFVPSFLLPFVLRGRNPAAVGRSTPARGLLWLQSHGTLIIGIGLAITGFGLLAVLGTQLLSQGWLLLALGLYAANLGLAFFVQRPNLRRLFGVRTALSDAERERWRERAKRQRYVSYLMAAVVGVIGFLMSAKPQL